MGTLYGDSIPTNGYKILGMNYVIWNPKINRDIDNAILSYGTLALLNGSGTIAGHQLSELSLDINFNYSYWFGGTHQARITILC